MGKWEGIMIHRGFSYLKRSTYLFILEKDKTFGEMAIETNSTRFCSMKAIENTILVNIPAEVYK